MLSPATQLYHRPALRAVWGEVSPLASLAWEQLLATIPALASTHPHTLLQYKATVTNIDGQARPSDS